MLVPMTLVFAAAAAVVAEAEPRPDSGAILEQGELDKPLYTVGREYLIPEGSCSGQITKNHYDCEKRWLSVVTLRVTAKTNNPVQIEITKDFEAVNIYGCGPVYVTLAHACEHNLKDDALLPPPPPAPVAAPARVRRAPSAQRASRSARAIAVLHPVPGFEKRN